MDKPETTHNPETAPAAQAAPAQAAKTNATDGQAIAETKILELCTARGAGKSICPSEVARALSGDPNDGPVWRPLMRSVRAAAATLQDQGRIAVLRKGKPVDIRTVKGVIRLALPPGS